MPMHREMYRGIRFGKHLNVSLTCARGYGDVEGWRLGVFFCFDWEWDGGMGRNGCRFGGLV